MYPQLNCIATFSALQDIFLYWRTVHYELNTDVLPQVYKCDPFACVKFLTTCVPKFWVYWVYFVWKIITTETKIPGIIYHAVWFMCIINYAIWCMVNNKIQISLFILCCYYFRHLTTYVTSWWIYLLAWIWLVAVNEQIHRHLNVWILEYIHMDNIWNFYSLTFGMVVQQIHKIQEFQCPVINNVSTVHTSNWTAFEYHTFNADIDKAEICKTPLDQTLSWTRQNIQFKVYSNLKVLFGSI